MAQRQQSPRVPDIIRDDGVDAVGLLLADHETVRSMFAEYDDLIDENAAVEEKRDLALLICAELWVHARIEEEIFYPAMRDALGDHELLDEAEVEHAVAADLIAQIEEMDAADDIYDATVRVLGEYVNHHADKEEQEMFPRAEKADVDLLQLAIELAARQMELKSELALVPDEDEVPGDEDITVRRS